MNESSGIMPVYVCTEEFTIQNDYYGTRYGNVRTVNVGDEYLLVGTPSPQKKLYKLRKVNDKFGNYLYLRKNKFKQCFCERGNQNDK